MVLTNEEKQQLEMEILQAYEGLHEFEFQSLKECYDKLEKLFLNGNIKDGVKYKVLVEEL